MIRVLLLSESPPRSDQLPLCRWEKLYRFCTPLTLGWGYVNWSCVCLLSKIPLSLCFPKVKRLINFYGC